MLKIQLIDKSEPNKNETGFHKKGKQKTKSNLLITKIVDLKQK